MANAEHRRSVPSFKKNRVSNALQTISSRFHWFLDVPSDYVYNMTPEGARVATIKAIERGTNDFIVTLVASTGFFMDSYLLFATNIITPMLDYVYWGSSTSSTYPLVVDCATLGGCALGMVTFGFLADKFGRRNLYGIVLLTLVGGTLGLVMSSPGYVPPEQLSGVTDASTLDWTKLGSMDVLSWLTFWRVVSGFGIGGDYPLAAGMVCEMAPTRKRSRMLAILFSMQAFGYATAALVSMVVVAAVRARHPDPAEVYVDQIWRWVVGFGLVPASIAVILRFFVPESPRYTLYVLNYPYRALQEADRLNQAGIQEEYQIELEDQAVRTFGNRKETTQSNSSGVQGSELEMTGLGMWAARREKNVIALKNFWQFLRESGNGKKLLVTASTWFLLDFTFFGLGFNASRNMAKIWEGPLAANATTPPVWNTDYNDSTPNIYDVLIVNNYRSLMASSISAITGAIVLIFVIEKWNRKMLQYFGFVILTLLFILIGSTYQATVKNGPGLTIALYAFAQFFFYLGPNATTFIIAAEIFPTKFRCTCHGISAAAGKLGSIIVQIILAYANVPGTCHNGEGDDTCHAGSPQSTWLGWIILIFAFPMLLGGVISYYGLPELQKRSGPNRGEPYSLEDLAEGQELPKS